MNHFWKGPFHMTHIYWDDPKMMMMIRVQIPWGKIRTRKKGRKKWEEGYPRGLLWSHNHHGREGPWYMYGSLLWGSALRDCSVRDHKPATCHTCAVWKSSTAGDGIGTATRSPTTAGSKPGGPSPLLPFMLGHLYYHKCPIKTACTLGNKKQMEYQGIWWLEPLSKLLSCLGSVIQTLTLQNGKSD